MGAPDRGEGQSWEELGAGRDAGPGWEPGSDPDLGWEPGGAGPGAGRDWEPDPDEELEDWEPGAGPGAGRGSGRGWEPNLDEELDWEPGGSRGTGRGTGHGAGRGWEPDPDRDIGWEPGGGQDLGWEPGGSQELGRGDGADRELGAGRRRGPVWGRGTGRHRGARRDSGAPDGQELSAAENQVLEAVLHAARALVLADLAADDVAAADVVSMLEDAVSERRWWLRQWPEGGPHIAGLLAQDIQDALLETRGRWPLCRLCVEPHALAVEPELGPDPYWVCEARGESIAAVGALSSLGS